jgi:hypothetical protein
VQLEDYAILMKKLMMYFSIYCKIKHLNCIDVLANNVITWHVASSTKPPSQLPVYILSEVFRDTVTLTSSRDGVRQMGIRKQKIC